MSGADEASSRCGFVALVGAPNAGKSTLINTMVGAKVAIVSPKVQTTRSRVLGITIDGPSQLIFMDTPGIFTPGRRLERAMVASAWQGATEADLVVLLVDASARRLDDDTRGIIERLNEAGRSAILALNKIDIVQRPRLLAQAAELNGLGSFTNTFMISATTGDGVPDLKRALAGGVPSGPWHYPEDEISDMPLRLFAAEITREKLFFRLHDELPYSLAVETESWDERDDGSVRIGQVVTVQRDSQKAIVLGKGGRMIRDIGAAARLELQEILDRPVHLSLFVKVRDRWLDDPDHYRPWGLNFNA